MKARIDILTLAVDDLEKSMDFYKKMGWQTEGIVRKEWEHGSVVLFNLRGDMKLALYPRKDLAWLAWTMEAPQGMRFSPPKSCITQLVNSIQEVDEVMDQAVRAGVHIEKATQKTPWGTCAGYFRDLDGHLWEVMWDPQIKVED